MGQQTHTKNYPIRLQVAISQRMFNYLDQPHINKSGFTRQALLEKIGEEALAEYEPEAQDE